MARKNKILTFADIKKVMDQEYSKADIEEIKGALSMDFVSLDLTRKAMRSYLNLCLKILAQDSGVIIDRNMIEFREVEDEIVSLVRGHSARVVSKVLTARIKNILKNKSSNILDAISALFQQSIRNRVQINFFRAFNVIPEDEGKWRVSLSKKI